MRVQFLCTRVFWLHNLQQLLILILLFSHLSAYLFIFIFTLSYIHFSLTSYAAEVSRRGSRRAPLSRTFLISSISPPSKPPSRGHQKRACEASSVEYRCLVFVGLSPPNPETPSGSYFGLVNERRRSLAMYYRGFSIRRKVSHKIKPFYSCLTEIKVKD